MRKKRNHSDRKSSMAIMAGSIDPRCYDRTVVRHQPVLKLVTTRPVTWRSSCSRPGATPKNFALYVACGTALVRKKHLLPGLLRTLSCEISFLARQRCTQGSRSTPKSGLASATSRLMCCCCSVFETLHANIVDDAITLDVPENNSWRSVRPALNWLTNSTVSSNTRRDGP